MKKITKKQVVDVIIFFVLLIIERQVGTRIPIPYDFAVSFALFYLFVLLFCYLRKPQSLAYLYRSYLFGCIIPNIIIQYLESSFAEGIPYYPVILFELLAILFAWQFFTKRHFTAPVVTTVLLFAGAYFWGREWRHLINFGNLHGTTSEVRPQDWQVYNENGDTLHAVKYADKIVIFDFWNTSCPPCFKKFPLLQQQYDKYKNDPRVILQAVNIPFAEDSIKTIFDRIKEKGYTFPVAIGNKDLAARFKIELFPTLIVFKNNTIIFRGDITNLGTLIEDELKK